MDAEIDRLIRARNILRPDEQMTLQDADGELWKPFRGSSVI